MPRISCGTTSGMSTRLLIRRLPASLPRFIAQAAGTATSSATIVAVNAMRTVNQKASQ